MKFRIAMALATVVMLLTPLMALADDSDQPALPDGRIVMYRDQVGLPSSSMALIWLMFIVVAMLMLAVMFKSAKRSHLD
ncbi:MAG TPA: hypothetical protein VHY37_14330 [Tepidisphaeraceae bacterium]|nr:hypothetical protein [Tepidisphaeraceae bacterium]